MLSRDSLQTMGFLAAAAAFSSLLAAACVAKVGTSAQTSTGTTDTTTTTGGGGAGGSNGSGGSHGGGCSGRTEGGQCLGGPNYGVDEGNPGCCRPCGAGEVAVDTQYGPHCERADAGASADGGAACPTYDAADKACTTADDCATVARGCYCGPQPVLGIAKALAAKAATCEADAAAHCALGCANMPGQVAEDGKGNQDGGTIGVVCDQGECKTVLE
jgi:hypothetical protein